MMAKKKRIKIESTDSKGEEKVVYLQLPDSKENKEAQLAYNTAFREALQSGAVLRQKLNQVMEEQGIWDEEKEKQYNEILETISGGEKQLNKGGISLTEARDVAISMRKSRAEFRGLIAERSSMDGNTAEGQADNERFSHLVFTCLLNEQGKRIFQTKEEYEQNATEPYVIDTAGQLAEKLYGLDPDYEAGLAENKFLTSYKFTDNDLRMVNKEGHLIDIDEDGNERLINEDGRFIAYDDDNEPYYIDRDGEKVSEDGDYEQKFSPFLDDSGNPVEVPKDGKEEVVAEVEVEEAKAEATEEEEVKAEESKASAKRGRPKKTESKTQTE
tara:strand:- start:16 stop:999 length:984 start_codon:yes stop_codon:yes gene_type:complete